MKTDKQAEQAATSQTAILHAIEMEKAFDPKSFEDRIYAQWKETGSFKPKTAGEGDTDRAGDVGDTGKESPSAASGASSGDTGGGGDKPPYTIVIPPPNVTGVLHLGHGLNQTLQDIVIRFHRMRGAPALWVPGTDHAGIATQNVVEKRLKKEGKSRHDLGRAEFVKETWRVKDEHHAIISKQIARMGCSVDWSRERFTLDEGLSKAVREVFVTLYER